MKHVSTCCVLCVFLNDVILILSFSLFYLIYFTVICNEASKYLLCVTMFFVFLYNVILVLSFSLFYLTVICNEECKYLLCVTMFFACFSMM